MTQQIPGVPEGWELVRIGVPDMNDWLIGHEGNPVAQSSLKRQLLLRQYAIIRKIEKPAVYRPFKDAEEYLPHWGKPVRLKDGTGFDSVVSTSRIGVYVAAGSSIIRHAMVDAFRLFEFADGTPFGVRIDE
jgi:hypothetical protein